jgi:SPASM domain peptide maturase of grasp-with-spasm system
MIKESKNRINRIVVYDSPFSKDLFFNDTQLYDLIYIENSINNFKHCGIVDMRYFNTNMSKVLESFNHNSCLHKKISIDKEGNIKNCPSMSQSFGNINNTTLEEALNHPDFKKYWNITKDQIEVCKDCEFRHICTDCRAYTEEPENQYSKPLKCGYNPYTNEWEEWSTNPLKQKAIEYYGMQELVKKDG